MPNERRLHRQNGCRRIIHVRTKAKIDECGAGAVPVELSVNENNRVDAQSCRTPEPAVPQLKAENNKFGEPVAPLQSDNAERSNEVGAASTSKSIAATEAISQSHPVVDTRDVEGLMPLVRFRPQ